MVNYKCYRCGYKCNQKGMLLKHLSRKYQCESKIDEISNNTILIKNKIVNYDKVKYTNILLSESYPNDISELSTSYPKVIQNECESIQKLSMFKCKYCKNEYKYRSG